METLENGLQTHSGVSLESCRSVDADAWCKTGPKEEAESHRVDQWNNLDKVISMYFGDGQVDQSAFRLIVAKY